VWSPTGRDDVFLSNVKIAWAESGAQSLMGTHISGDWAGLWAEHPEDDSIISLCAPLYGRGLNSKQVSKSQRSESNNSGYTNQGTA
jgi:hypothetical protein